MLRRLLWSWPGWDGALVTVLLSSGLGLMWMTGENGNLDTVTKIFLALGPVIGYSLRLVDERSKEMTERPPLYLE
jgi:hypothetical protein